MALRTPGGGLSDVHAAGTSSGSSPQQPAEPAKTAAEFANRHDPSYCGRMERSLATLDFAIVGAQKSGSTALHSALASHPAVWMPPGEQPHLEDPHYSPQAVADLDATLSDAPETASVGIKRPDYLGHPEAPARLSRLAPRARVLVVLRDPVDRAVSAFYHYRHYGLVPNTGPNDGLRALLRGQAPARFARASEVLEFGLYGQHLRQWERVFRRSDMLVLQSEALRSDAAATLRQVEEFLGLPRGDVSPAPASNLGPYSELRRTYMRLVRSLVGLAPTDGATGLSRSALGRRALAFDDGWLAPRFRGRPEPLAGDVRDWLVRFYADDQRSLSAFLATP